MLLSVRGCECADVETSNSGRAHTLIGRQWAMMECTSHKAHPGRTRTYIDVDFVQFIRYTRLTTVRNAFCIV